MNSTDSMRELVAGYEAYSTVEEISLSAASDAPATTPGCAMSAVLAVSVSAAGYTYYDIYQRQAAAGW